MGVGALVAALVVSLGAFGVGQFVAGAQTTDPQTNALAAAMLPLIEPPPAADELPLALGHAGIGSVWNQLAEPLGSLPATPPGVFAQSAPSSVAAAPPIRADEVVGVVPYWALPGEASLDLKGVTTVVYAGLGINSNGSVQTSGTEWDAYLSQDFVNLVDAAHADGARIVLSLQDFDQTSLDQLSASPTAPATLAQSVLLLVKMRDLDGVNLDLEGQGSQDQTGVTNLVSAVSQTLKAANPHYQVTVDTNASSAGTSGGIYDLSALTGAVDAFLVTADQLNLAATPSATSRMTSADDSLQSTLNEYASEVPADKVIAILPLFGLEWQTSDDTLQAKPVGAPDVETPAAVRATRHSALWDAITKTAWTPFRVGTQWHEAFFETPRALRLVARTAAANGIAGVGVWGLGTDGTDDAPIISALASHASPDATTSQSASGSDSGTSSVPSTTTTTTTPVAPASTTTTTSPPSTASSSSPSGSPWSMASGVWIDSRTDLIPTAVPSGLATAVGVMSGFTTSYPGLTCLEQEQFLNVYVVSGQPDDFYVVAQVGQGDCTNAAFVFYDPNSPIPVSGS
jgi:Glycosyl hydrolases family 18